VVSSLGTKIDISQLSQQQPTTQDIQKLFEQFSDFSFLHLLASVINTSISTILAVFIMVFSYVFLFRLRDEFPASKSQKSEL